MRLSLRPVLSATAGAVVLAALATGCSSGSTEASTTPAAPASTQASSLVSAPAEGGEAAEGGEGAEAGEGGEGREGDGEGREEGGRDAQPSAPANAGTTASISMADVEKHATPSDCWTAVSGNVYDVTGWISMHPGGPGVIESLCGTDGTASFEGAHSGQREPSEVLGQLQIGVLAG